MLGTKAGDPRVERLLKELELSYETDKDGDFKLTFMMEDNRSQVVFICSETAELGNFEIREVFSVALIVEEGSLSADMANALLIYNSRVKLGSWRLIRQGKGCIAAFSAQIAANTDARSLMTTLRAVMATADEVEQKLTGEDRF
ncbi:MAG: hypothetical protein ACAI35_28465 [Candidatus Methylacidiphilales bacterium]|nr:hypothetical protein [Candidatus Methylacidiphilales bacterium]